MFDERIIVRGGGDLGSGVALRLWRTGFPVVVLETSNPIAVRRSVAFSEAVYDGETQVEGVRARLSNAEDVDQFMEQGVIPVLVDPQLSSLQTLQASVVVDAILAKRNTGTDAAMAPLVIGLGPGFTAGSCVHAVVETNRGPDLGRVIWKGQAEPDSGEPAPVHSRRESRVLRAPVAGVLENIRGIGDIVEENEMVARVDSVPVVAQFKALLRGLAREGLTVHEGMKIGDIDPRLDPDLCLRVSDKSLAIAGGVLEAVLTTFHGRRL